MFQILWTMYYLSYIYKIPNFIEFWWIILFQVFGFSLSFFENKNFIIVNNIEEIDIPDIVHSFSESSKYRILLKPIIGALIMLRMPMSEGIEWNL